jgi:hypothetical protein
MWTVWEDGESIRAAQCRRNYGVLEMKNRRAVCLLCAAFLIASAIVGRGGIARGAGARRSPAGDAAALGIFEESSDVGAVVHAGSVAYDAGKGSYAIRGSGENMWFGKDEFQFAWKKCPATWH